jgi:hypothetical protein
MKVPEREVDPSDPADVEEAAERLGAARPVEPAKSAEPVPA